MKMNTVRFSVLTAVAAAMMALPAFANQAQTARVITPDPNDWQYQAALETGNLPTDAGVLHEGSGPKVNVPTVVYGGVAYRIGIDTP